MGAALVVGDIFLSKWRKALTICSVSLLPLADIFGWSVAYSLVSYP
jgi:hypothetical protein